MSFNLSEYVKLPKVLQVVGVVVFGITVWKGVHGFLPSFGLIAGAGMAYVGKQFDSLYK
jgi:type IV secretory pathway VirB2 component (pilin)